MGVSKVLGVDLFVGSIGACKSYKLTRFRIRSKHDDFQEHYFTEANAINLHQKEELDAAEALTFLAGNCKSRWVK